MLSLSFALVFGQGQRFRRGATDTSAVPVQIVVTAKASTGRELPPLSHADLSVVLDEANRPVTECVALQDDSAGLELYVLIDEKVKPAATAGFDELRRFVSSQAAATAVGIAYMHNGEAEIVLTPTKDLARAAKALRLPSGNTSFLANPFNSLSALINGWSTGAARREVVVVTDGVDTFGDIGAASTYLENAIQDAQRAGVQVFSIYAPGTGDAADSRVLNSRWPGLPGTAR
uniref:VWFA domain-containing protein n=1 Tax=uncultured organism TaxID=155900 RepID=A0A8A1V6C9_9ZZZZ|nr:hypothetical protein [uncultured organism]